MSMFKWNNGEVYIKPPTGRTRAYYFYLKTAMGVYDMPEGFEKEISEQALFLLSRVDHVTGDIGFNVPTGDTSEANLKLFCDNLFDADEDLFLIWNSTVINARAGGNDDSLLPPGEVDDSKKKPTKAKDKIREPLSSNG